MTTETGAAAANKLFDIHDHLEKEAKALYSSLRSLAFLDNAEKNELRFYYLVGDRVWITPAGSDGSWIPKTEEEAEVIANLLHVDAVMRTKYAKWLATQQ